MKQFATYNDNIHQVITSPDLLDASCMPTNCLEDLQEGSLFFNLTTKISPWRMGLYGWSFLAINYCQMMYLLFKKKKEEEGWLYRKKNPLC